MKVFISRSIKGYEKLAHDLEDRGGELVAHSLIDTVPVPFVSTTNTDWVFFSSSNAVRHYFSQATAGNQKLAAIGKATAAVLEKYAKVDFVGNDRDMVVVGKAFAKCLESENVLFPISSRSLKTVQKQLPAEQIEEVVAYTTRLVEKHIEACDAYVFSSPSNVEAFALCNEIPASAVVLVPGDRTREAVRKITSVRIIDVESLAISHVSHTIFSGILS